MNSKNIFDTFRCIFQLRRITTASIFLFLIWSLSPLGGQASLRVLYKENATATDTIPLRYLDTGPLGQMYTATWSGAGITQGLGVVLDAALYQDYQTKTGPQDAWGNLKIPRLEGFANSTKNPEGWYEICEPPCPKIRDVETYTSLIGFPVVGIPSTDRTQFSLETSYVSLECSKFHAITESEDWSESVLNITCPDCFDVYGLNQTQSSIARLAEFLAVPGNEQAESTIQPTDFAQTLIVEEKQTFNRGKAPVSMRAFCKAFRTSAETTFDCYFGGCSAVRTRPSETDHRGKNLTIFDYWCRSIFGYIMDISQTDLWGIPMTVELFMKDPATQPVTPLDSPELWSYLGLNTLISAVNFTEFTQDEFATRLALLLNTISHIFLTLGQLEAGLPSDLSLYGPDHTLVGGSNYLKGLTISELADFGDFPSLDSLQKISRVVGSPRFIGASANATHVAYREVYNPNIAWVVILLLASGVLVGLGLFGIWRSRNLRAPDIFDPVMAFTYGNKYIDVPEYGSTLDAKRRARLLPNVEVRLGDVDGHWGVGKVALGMAQDVHLLKKDRLYE